MQIEQAPAVTRPQELPQLGEPTQFSPPQASGAVAPNQGVIQTDPGPRVAGLGMTFVVLTDNTRARYRIEPYIRGVLILGVQPTSVAGAKGLRAGDVIAWAGNRAVARPSDVLDAVSSARDTGRASILLQIHRNGRSFFVPIALPRQGSYGATAPAPIAPSQSLEGRNYSSRTSPRDLGAPRWERPPETERAGRLYPERALERGIGGRVVVRCQADYNFSLSCGVISEDPPGYGFGRAALAVFGNARLSANQAGGSLNSGDWFTFPIRFQPPTDR